MDIEAVFNSQFKRVYFFFYGRTGLQQPSEDLTSMVFLRFAEKSRDLIINDPAKFLNGIVKNVWLEYLREKYRSTELLIAIENATDESNVADIPHKAFVDSEVIHYVARLTPKLRQMIELRYVNNLSVAEIADHLGRDANYVKVTHRRALRRLREMYEGEMS